jgi:hypothetical protein
LLVNNNKQQTTNNNNNNNNIEFARTNGRGRQRAREQISRLETSFARTLRQLRNVDRYAAVGIRVVVVYAMYCLRQMVLLRICCGSLLLLLLLLLLLGATYAR